jgi:hypothetical protein
LDRKKMFTKTYQFDQYEDDLEKMIYWAKQIYFANFTGLMLRSVAVCISNFASSKTAKLSLFG